MLVMDGYGDDSLEQRLCRPRQPPGAALVDRHHQLAGSRLHVRDPAPGLCRLRRRGQGDGARRLRRGHLRRALPRRGPADARTAAMPSTCPISTTTRSASCGPFKRKFVEAFGEARAAPRADHRPASRPRVRPASRERGDHPPHRARPARASSRSATSCMTGGVALNCVANGKILEHTDVRRIWVPPCASDTGAPLGSALWHYHQTLGQPARVRADPPLLRPGLQRRPGAAGAAGRRAALPALRGGRAAAPGGAGPGRRQDRRLVPGPLRDGPARARQPLDPGRPAPRRDARHPQRQGQEARGLPPVRAGRAGRAVGRILRDRASPTRS